MNRYLASLSVAVVCVVGCASSRDELGRDFGRAAGEKLAYVDKLARFDLSQIMLGRTAMGNSTSVAVRDLAKTLINDHRAHLTSLVTWAQARRSEAELVANLGPSDGVGGAGFADVQGGFVELIDRLDQHSREAEEHATKQIQDLADLASHNGSEFDRAFAKRAMKQQQQGHKLVSEGIDRYQEDVVFAALLAKTRPVIEEHIAHSDVLETQLANREPTP